MSKSKILFEKLTSLLAQGLISYKDLSDEVINIIKSHRNDIILKMKLSTKEETDILKKRIEPPPPPPPPPQKNRRTKKVNKS